MPQYRIGIYQRILQRTTETSVKTAGNLVSTWISCLPSMWSLRSAWLGGFALRDSGLCYRIVWQMLTDISEESDVSSEDGGCRFLRNVGNHIRDGTNQKTTIRTSYLSSRLKQWFSLKGQQSLTTIYDGMKKETQIQTLYLSWRLKTEAAVSFETLAITHHTLQPHKQRDPEPNLKSVRQTGAAVYSEALAMIYQTKLQHN